MRVGIDAHMIGDHSGGNESFYTNIINNMNPPKNMEIILFVKKGADLSALTNKFKRIEFQESSALKRNFFELPKLCKEYELDLLHTQYFIPFNRPCPVVCTIHDICFEHYSNIFTKKEYYTQKLLIPYAAKKSKAVFTVSNHAKQDIASHYHIPESNLVVTYNAVNQNFRKLNEEELNESELRNKFDITGNRIILSVGNLQPRKNLPRLMRAFVKLKKDSHFSDVQLVVVGKKAWMFDDIMKESADNNKDSRKLKLGILLLGVLGGALILQSSVFDKYMQIDKIEGGGSITGRLAMYAYYFNGFMQHPIMGQGFIKPINSALTTLLYGPYGFYYLEDVGIVGCLFTFGLVGVFLFLTFITKGMKTIISGYKDRSIFSDSVVLGVFMFLVFTMPTLFLFDYARNGFLMFVLLFMTPKSERN